MQHILSKNNAQEHKLGMLGAIFVAFALAVSAMIGAASQVNATSHGQSFDFTQAELDNNWEADRQLPSDGVNSVSMFSRDNVARLGINSESTAAGGFQRTEGIKTIGDQNFGNKVEVDLYLDPSWQDRAVRAGLWVVGDKNDGSTGTAARDLKFGILEFINADTCVVCSSHPDNAPNLDFTGFRIWSSDSGWTEYLATPFSFGDWVTLGIELDTVTQMYNYTIDGVIVGSAPAGEHFIREVFLNSYNYGEDTFTTLNNTSYSAYWHGGVIDNHMPETKEDCKNGGWMDVVRADGTSFKNQGHCVSYVASDGKAKGNSSAVETLVTRVRGLFS